MSDPQRTPHPEDPAEGGNPPEAGGPVDSGRTPHPEQPAEGDDRPGGADTPG